MEPVFYVVCSCFVLSIVFSVEKCMDLFSHGKFFGVLILEWLEYRVDWPYSTGVLQWLHVSFVFLGALCLLFLLAGWVDIIHKHVLILLCLCNLCYCDLNKAVCYINKHLCLTVVHCLSVFLSESNMGIKKLWSHLKNIQNLHFLKMKLKLI
jgi:hypothetical protein